MTLPSNYTDDNEHTRRTESDNAVKKYHDLYVKPNIPKKKSEKGLIGIILLGYIIIIAASSYNTTIGFLFAILFGLIFIGLGQYSNNNGLFGLLMIAAFIGFCIPILMLWNEHRIWLENFHHRYPD